MHLVDDEHLEAVAHRRNRQSGDDHLADVVDLGVGGGIDLEHVDVAALGNLAAGVALAAGVHRRPGETVERAGQNARGRGLADTPRSRKDKRLRETVLPDGVAQGLRHATLADDVIEPLRAPLAGDYLVRHGMLGATKPGGWRVPAATRKSLRHMSVTT